MCTAERIVEILKLVLPATPLVSTLGERPELSKYGGRGTQNVLFRGRLVSCVVLEVENFYCALSFI